MLSPRQIHLDFHTSENIPSVAENFEPKAFAKMVKDAYISSMTVFARCHHGWLYYPSKKFPELIHPHLKNKNLMVEQIDALHEQGVRAPVYITVQWDYHTATTHPEWLIRKADGSHEGSPFTEPGFYQSLCVNTSYYDFLEAQTREVCELLGDKLDGFFFDIVGNRPCLCAKCRAEMKERGIDMTDEEALYEFAAFTMERFKRKMSAVVREYSSDCTIFYNAGHIGPCTKRSADAYTHFELESLPSGSWGYLHFPITARYAKMLGKDCLGQTGKFHTSWGDFHSLKNQAALEFECLHMLSMGFASLIGDQLHPSGELNAATYRLIGKVYQQLAEREEWGRPSKSINDVALLTSEGTLREQQIPNSVRGACQMLMELAIQFDIIDRDMDFSAYKLIILPDDFVVEKQYQDKIDAYVKHGGKVIAVKDGGLSPAGKYPACFGTEYQGKTEEYPDFIVAEGPLAKGLEPENEYVIYMQGNAIAAKEGKQILSANAPYFKREGDRFCSHMYTPSSKQGRHTAAVQNGGVIVFSHPVFLQYRENAPQWCKQMISNAIDELMEKRLVRHNGPSTMIVNLLDQPDKKRVNAHVLSYIPVRKSDTIDIIEERTVLHNVELEFHLPYEIKGARLVPEGKALELKAGKVTIPEVDGHCIVELSY